MKLNIIEEDAKSITLEFENTDRAIPELIKSKLLLMKDVTFATVAKEHPEIGHPRLVVKASKNPKPLVEKAVEQALEDIKELSSQIPKK